MKNRYSFTQIDPSKLILRSVWFVGVCLVLALAACKNGSGNPDATDSLSNGSAALSSELEIVEKTDAYGNIERYSRRLDDYAKQGQYSLISPEGELLETAEYHNDTLHGLRVLFFENGDTQTVERYDYGIFAGPFQAYYEGGGLELEGNYEANSMEGVWKRYYKSGQLMEVVSFHDNAENGPFTEYHENGQIKAEGYYKDGDNEHGSLKIYNEEGVLVKTMDCRHGVCRTMWEKES